MLTEYLTYIDNLGISLQNPDVLCSSGGISTKNSGNQFWGVFKYYLYLNIKLSKKVFELSI